MTEQEEFEFRKRLEDEQSASQQPQAAPQEQGLSNRPSAIKDLVQNPPSMKHPLGAALRTLSAAGELYQGMGASAALDMQAGKPQDILGNLLKVATGDRPAQYGDVFQGAGVPKPLAAAGGLYTDVVLSPGGAELLSGLVKGGALAAKEIPNIVKPVLKWEDAAQQANKAKGALDALQKSYGSIYDVALQEVKDVPTEVKFGQMPQKVLDVIKNKKDIYGVEFTPQGSIVNTIENVDKIRNAANELITPAMRAESTKTEISQIRQFAGHISSEMRKAADGAGKPIDDAMNAYGQFKQQYNIVNSRLMDKYNNAMGNKLKKMVQITTDPVIKSSLKVLSKDSPELKSVVDSMKRRDLLKAVLLAAPTIESAKRMVTGHF